jgi:signal transduction histidine kinase
VTSPITGCRGVHLALRDRWNARVDRVLAALLILQWGAAIGIAIALAPVAGPTADARLVAALAAGPILDAIPLALLRRRPAWTGTRHAIAVAQALWSALLITIARDHAPMYLHAFGSLAVLALYRDWTLLATAAAVLLGNSAASLLGAGATHGLHPLELAGWLAAVGGALGWACVWGEQELRAAAARQARIGELERLAEEARELERYRALIEGADAIAFEVDLEAGRVLYVAPQARRLLRCTRAQLTEPAYLASIVHPDDRARIARAIGDVRAGRHPAGQWIDCRLIATDQRIVHARALLGERGPAAPGAPGTIRGFALDVTRQRLHEADRQQSQKLESVGRLAAGVAHEINTPIQFVGDSVEFVRGAMEALARVLEQQRAVVDGVLAGAADPAAARRADELFHDAEVPFLFEELPRSLERACDGIERVARIVRSMRTFAHPDQPEMIDVDLNRTIEATLTVARNEYRYVADLVTDYGELPPVRCHAGEISQVILNVVINAAHAIAEVVGETGGRGLISVRTRRAGDRVEIAIADTGTGIPEAVAARLFDPFFTTKAVDRGTGQGLAIARAIVDRHRGTITFDTSPGSGTTFCIRIPIAGEPAQELEAA